MALPRRAKRGPAECRQRQSRTRAPALHAPLAGWAMPSCANLPKGHTQTRPTTGQTRPRYNNAVPTPYSCRYGWGGGVRKPCQGRTYPCLKAGAPGQPACQRGRGKRARRRRTWRTAARNATSSLGASSPPRRAPVWALCHMFSATTSVALPNETVNGLAVACNPARQGQPNIGPWASCSRRQRTNWRALRTKS